MNVRDAENALIAALGRIDEVEVLLEYIECLETECIWLSTEVAHLRRKQTRAAKALKQALDEIE